MDPVVLVCLDRSILLGEMRDIVDVEREWNKCPGGNFREMLNLRHQSQISSTLLEASC